ncbi:MAG TPA: (deoxy)nucleoside triphosphate pyrophosphohydrolase [Leifsonia sp.]
MEPLIVVAAVIRDGDRILACRRAPGKDAAGRWEFPGGKIEPGETPEAALARELREELGVDAQVGPLLDRTTTRAGGRRIDLACYAVAVIGDRPTRSTDHDELRWLSVRELRTVDWADADLPAVAILEEQP